MKAPMRVHGVSAAAACEQARSLLDLVGLAARAPCLPQRLSDGPQQRMAIAQALAIDPTLLMFDEPPSARDPELVGKVPSVIRKLPEGAMTMPVITHEVRFARDVLEQPREIRTQRFLRVAESG